MPLTLRQQRFVREYLIDLNATSAYERAGYRVANEQVAASCAHKLLRNAEIREAVDRAQCGRLDRLELDADWVVIRFKQIYLRAMSERDFGAAIKALDNIGKFLGIYERHQHQKYGLADIDRLKRELEEVGVDFERVATRAGMDQMG